ncbi:MAG: hypothetical protein HOC70_11430 [Gammaproteobacteria bacterium]|nr:hypothetical protein [Gammaproteobacteria bacterium]MBT7370157.1 hypothetical protein [Gammaproteobacteria bacterium]
MSSEIPFSPDQRQRLQELSDLMIPASEPMPGAGDSEIFAGTLETLARHQELVVQTLDRLESLEDIQSVAPDFAQVFQTAVATSYYRDDRVLEGLGLPVRAPYPEGHEVDKTDWSLLDPVRKREPFYRNVGWDTGDD